MKNIILGILGCMIAVYTIVSCLSIYSISTRKNEMENCISQVLKYHLNRYYATGVSDTEVEAICPAGNPAAVTYGIKGFH